MPDISPSVAAIGPKSPVLRSRFDENPANWGMILAADSNASSAVSAPRVRI
jgi:hypothetical protein